MPRTPSKTAVLIALQKSTAHWRRLEDAIMTGKRSAAREEGWYGENCALCSCFKRRNYPQPNCSKCPIGQHAKAKNCEGTPWQKAADSLTAFVQLGIATEHQKKAVQAQRCFVEKLQAAYTKQHIHTMPYEENQE